MARHCLRRDLFPVDGSIYLGDKENTEACEVCLPDRWELAETFFPHPFFLPRVRWQPFVFIKWPIYFPRRFKYFLIFSRLTKLHLT